MGSLQRSVAETSCSRVVVCCSLKWSPLMCTSHLCLWFWSIELHITHQVLTHKCSSAQHVRRQGQSRSIKTASWARVWRLTLHRYNSALFHKSNGEFEEQISRKPVLMSAKICPAEVPWSQNPCLLPPSCVGCDIEPGEITSCAWSFQGSEHSIGMSQWLSCLESYHKFNFPILFDQY